eukprot:g2674.t1
MSNSNDNDDGVYAIARGLASLTVPVFVSMVTWSAMKTTDTSILGHLGTEYLEAASYSDLWTSSFGVFIMGHILGVFCSQSFGAAKAREDAARDSALRSGKSSEDAERDASDAAKRIYRNVGVWSQIGSVVLLCIGALVAVLWILTEPALGLFGLEASLRSKAGYFATVLSSCIPARIAATTMSQFFQSQKIMHPSVAAGMVTMLFNLVLGVVLVLGIPFAALKLGFVVCPIITSVNEYLQTAIYLVVYVYAQRLHERCWTPFTWNHFTKKKIDAFVEMYVPAALSIGSDFWRFAVVGVLASRLSSTDLAVFNSAYRILWIVLTLIGAIGSAVGILVGSSLGAGNVRRAKHVAYVGIGVASVLAAVLAFVVLAVPRLCGRIFSSDDLILDRYERVRVPLAVLTFLMNMSVALERVPTAMGRTREVFLAGLCGSWIGQVPGCLIFTVFVRKDLVGILWGCNIGYGLLVCILSTVIVRSDWDRYAAEAQQRAGARSYDSFDNVGEELEEDRSALGVVCDIYASLACALCDLVTSALAAVTRVARDALRCDDGSSDASDDGRLAPLLGGGGKVMN